MTKCNLFWGNIHICRFFFSTLMWLAMFHPINTNDSSRDHKQAHQLSHNKSPFLSILFPISSPSLISCHYTAVLAYHPITSSTIPVMRTIYPREFHPCVCVSLHLLNCTLWFGLCHFFTKNPAPWNGILNVVTFRIVNKVTESLLHEWSWMLVGIFAR